MSVKDSLTMMTTTQSLNNNFSFNKGTEMLFLSVCHVLTAVMYSVPLAIQLGNPVIFRNKQSCHHQALS